MTVRIRLQRFGRRNRPFYRVVVADSRAPRNGKFIELVGTYNPLATQAGIKEVTFNADRTRYWISVGAQPSDRVAWLLGQFGILPPKVVPVARAKRTIPRKEWKEMQKGSKEAKQFHTSTSLTAPPQIGTPSSPYQILSIEDNVKPLNSVVWGTGGLGGSTGAANTVAESDVESRWWGSASSQTERAGLEGTPSVLPSPVMEVLNSHLSLLGPTAVLRLSESTTEFSESNRICGSSRSQGCETAMGFWESILRKLRWGGVNAVEHQEKLRG